MIYGFEVADVSIAVDTTVAITDKEYANRFRKEVSDPAFVCSINTCDGFQEAKGKKVLDDYLTRLYLDGENITNDQIFSPVGPILFRSFYKTQKTGQITVQADNASLEYLTQDKLWSILDLPYQLSFQNVLPLHSSSVDIGGRAVLFCAPSGTGKSTQARLWEQYRGAVQLNGDKNAVRLRGNTPYAFGLPFCGSSTICENYALPIAAIVLLSQAKENTVTRLGFTASLSAVANNCVGHNVIPGTSGRILNSAIDIVTRIPVFHLACTPDERAVEALEKVLS